MAIGPATSLKCSNFCCALSNTAWNSSLNFSSTGFTASTHRLKSSDNALVIGCTASFTCSNFSLNFSTISFAFSNAFENQSFTFAKKTLTFDQFLMIRNAATAIAATTMIAMFAGDVSHFNRPPATFILLPNSPIFFIGAPIALTILPNMINAGPAAATIPAILTTWSFCSSDSELNFSAIFCSHSVAFLTYGVIRSPKLIAMDSTVDFRMVS